MTEATDAPVRAPKPYKILIVVDMQADFVMRWGLLPVAGAESIIIPGIGILSKLDAGEYAAVLFTFDSHIAAEYVGGLENVGQPDLGIPGFPLHCEKGTPGWENVFNPSLVPVGIPTYELHKTVFDAWERDSFLTPVFSTDRKQRFGKGRDEFFALMKAQGVTVATVLGVASDFCVKDMIRGLLAFGFAVEVIEECTAGIARDMAQTVADEFPGRVTLI